MCDFTRIFPILLFNILIQDSYMSADLNDKTMAKSGDCSSGGGTEARLSERDHVERLVEAVERFEVQGRSPRTSAKIGYYRVGWRKVESSKFQGRC